MLADEGPGLLGIPLRERRLLGDPDPLDDLPVLEERQGRLGIPPQAVLVIHRRAGRFPAGRFGIGIGWPGLLLEPSAAVPMSFEYGRPK